MVELYDAFMNRETLSFSETFGGQPALKKSVFIETGNLINRRIV